MIAIYIILGFLSVAIIFAFYNRRISHPLKEIINSQRDELLKTNERMISIQNQLFEVAKTLDNRLGESAKMIDFRINESNKLMQGQNIASQKIIQEVTEKLVKLDETNSRVGNFAEQLKKLQDVLQNPKQRGVIGEYYLETVLKNVLPPDSYQMQYSFQDGSIVDAVIFIGKQIIPIDSKFSLENYNRLIEANTLAERKSFEQAFINDLKERINETAKYVKPEKGTMNFAFMFIPSEAIYYDLIINKIGAVTEDTKNLLQYAGQKGVIPVSPTSFLAYLQTVLQGLRNQKISQQTNEIVKQVENLAKHLGAYDEYMKKLGNNMRTTVNMYNNAYSEFKKIDKDVTKISGQAIGIEPKLIDVPVVNENSID